MPLSSKRVCSTVGAAVHEKETFSVGVLVPESRLGSVIGKQGLGLQQARLESGGCKLVVRETETEASRRVNLIGDVNQVSAAFGIVSQKVYGEGSTTVFIPASRAGTVIGKGGENLKLIRQTCGVKVHVEREFVGTGERILTFDGESHKLRQAFSMAMSGAKTSAPTSTDKVEENLSLGLLIPEERIGVVIGSHGDSLKQIRMQSGGCKVEVKRKSERNGSRRVNITGNISQILAAFAAICQKTYQDEKNGFLTICISESQVGSVVGRGGENLKLVRETCGVKVNVEREPVVDEQTGRQERSVTFDGESHRLNQAFSMAICGAETHTGNTGTDLFEETLSLGFIVAEDRVGAVIGSQGAGLKAARLQSGGCKVEVTGESKTNGGRRLNLTGIGSRRVNLKGTINQILAAFDIICRKAYDEDDHLVPTMLIPERRAGPVVGKGGENLELLRQCGAKVHVERKAIISEHTGRQERRVTFEGTPHQLNHALSMMAQSDVFGANTRTSGKTIADSFTHVQSPIHDRKQIQILMLLPTKDVAAIADKDGIKWIEGLSGCRCLVTNPYGGGIVIRGTYDQAELAQTTVWQQMHLMAQEANEEPPTEASVLFFVRKEAAGAVLGKQGAHLRFIGEESSTVLTMGKHEVEGYRPITIKGCWQSVLVAEKLVFDIVKRAHPVQSSSTKRKASHLAPEVLGR